MCDDDFNYYAAVTICKKMGFPSAQKWENGNNFDLQDNLDIKLDDVRCLDDHEWSSCSYDEYHDCGHSEDVFLTCGEGKLFT